jgi:hypothetical protein
MATNSEFIGQPNEPETFIFSQTRTGRGGWTVIIKSHVAYDSRWPWWRRWIADLRGRP